MSERDWEKELAKIDKQLTALPDDEIARTTPAAGAAAPTRPAAPSPAAASATKPPRPPSKLMLWARVLLALGLGVGVLFWPYDARCGAGLAGLLAVIALIVLSGVWSAVWTWRHRAGRLHLVSLAVVLWGLGLGAREVLPRTGLGIPSMDRPAIWACQ